MEFDVDEIVLRETSRMREEFDRWFHREFADAPRRIRKRAEEILEANMEEVASLINRRANQDSEKLRESKRDRDHFQGLCEAITEGLLRDTLSKIQSFARRVLGLQRYEHLLRRLEEGEVDREHDSFYLENIDRLHEEICLAAVDGYFMPTQKGKRGKKVNRGETWWKLFNACRGEGAKQWEVVAENILHRIHELLYLDGAIQVRLRSSRYDPTKGGSRILWLGTSIGIEANNEARKRRSQDHLQHSVPLTIDVEDGNATPQAIGNDSKHLKTLNQNKMGRGYAVLLLTENLFSLSIEDVSKIASHCPAGFQERIEEVRNGLREKINDCQEKWYTTFGFVDAKEKVIAKLRNQIAVLREQLKCTNNPPAYMRQLLAEMERKIEEIEEAEKIKIKKQRSLKTHDTNLARSERPSDEQIGYILGVSAKNVRDARSRCIKSMKASS